MALIKTKGLVIKEQAYKEQDKILTIFTENEGKIQCMARGVRRQKSGLLASTQIFAYGEFVYYPGKNFGIINQASLIEAFYPLRNDLTKMALAAYLLDLINNAFDFYQKSPEILKLLLHVLFYLSGGKAKNDLVLVGAFQLKLVSVLGYRPGITQCMICESDQKPAVFSIEGYGILCKNCKHQATGYSYKLSPGMLELLRDFLRKPIKELKEQDASTEDATKVNDLLDHYIGYCVGKSSKAYTFYKSLLNPLSKIK
ncbi:DNA repair protein RecO [Acetobacterium paludosum]|uniref:DNA repair protein RecO n=1 Tax=Acetobacterium paludosum TaxID=52693 RepID=A0A923HY94_9FIRM|nr:DNA repair protein RecO [Acetobacterium paludosum]MBC3889817.1 DNA repair protein RecO [Acetobacterium paludosum]